MITHAQPTLSSAAAHAPASRPLELLEARQRRDTLKTLLRTEQAAMADFLVALADFDRRRGWEPLGHAHLFAFLLVELGLSPAPTFWRQEAARLLQRFPGLEQPLRQGQLCLSTMGELAKVLTKENQEAVLPRFLGISTREAREVVAELQPRESPPMRTVVRSLATVRGAEAASFLLDRSCDSASPSASAAQAGLPPEAATQNTDPESLWTSKTQVSPPARDEPRWAEPRRDEVDPLTAELSRLSTTVSRRFLEKLKSARQGLGHAIPRATTEQVLEAALDLLLERQARARGQVKRPRAVRPMPTPAPASTATPKPIPTAIPTAIAASASAPAPGPATTPDAVPTPASTATAPPPHRRDGPREAIPATVKRAVWARDQGRCGWPLDGGGCCGSTYRLELDHIDPWAKDGEPTEENLRLLCGRHNRLAARRVFGERVMARYGSPYWCQGRRPG